MAKFREQAMAECAQLPQYSLKAKNTFLEININNDSEDDLDLENEFTKRQVTDPPPPSSNIIVMSKKNDKDVDCSDGTSDLPKVSELVEPELEPDLQPYAQAGMVRQVTEEHWCSWNQRQWEPDMEQSCVNTRIQNSVSKRRSWADETDDIYELERKPEEKVAIALSPALDMPMATNSVAPSAAHMSVQAIAASALLGCSFGHEQQTNTQRLEDAKLKSGRRRKRESLIDQAARQLQKEERKQQVRENGRARPQTMKTRVPMFCHQCGASCQPQFKFCRFCGVATIGVP